MENLSQIFYHDLINILNISTKPSISYHNITATLNMLYQGMTTIPITFITHSLYKRLINKEIQQQNYKSFIKTASYEVNLDLQLEDYRLGLPYNEIGNAFLHDKNTTYFNIHNLPNIMLIFGIKFFINNDTHSIFVGILVPVIL